MAGHRTITGLVALGATALLAGCGSGFVLPTIRSIPYSKEHPDQNLDLFLPSRGREPYPVVLWIHGGGWEAGDKWDGVFHAAPLLERGMAVVAINYRLSGDARFPAQIHDCKAAVRWVRAHASEYGFDPGRIGAWGASAGGHLAALLGTSGDDPDLEGAVGDCLGVSSRVQAVVDFCGPTELSGPSICSAVLGSPVEPPDLLSYCTLKLLGLLDGAPQLTSLTPIEADYQARVTSFVELASKASPVSYVTPDDPPFLVVHGTLDAVVHWDQSRRLADQLVAKDVPCKFHSVEGAGHSLPSHLNFEAAAFFDRQLNGGS